MSPTDWGDGVLMSSPRLACPPAAWGVGGVWECGIASREREREKKKFCGGGERERGREKKTSFCSSPRCLITREAGGGVCVCVSVSPERLGVLRLPPPPSVARLFQALSLALIAEPLGREKGGGCSAPLPARAPFRCPLPSSPATGEEAKACRFARNCLFNERELSGRRAGQPAVERRRRGSGLRARRRRARSGAGGRRRRRGICSPPHRPGSLSLSSSPAAHQPVGSQTGALGFQSMFKVTAASSGERGHKKVAPAEVPAGPA